VRTLIAAVLGLVALVLTAGAVFAGARLPLPLSNEPAELSVRVADAADGGELSARLQLVKSGPFQARRTLIAPRGAQKLSLEPGEYRIWASHGPEWSVAERRVSLEGGERRVLTLALRREVQPGRYAACDLHVHTNASRDSQVALQERLASAAAEGLRLAVVTDHNHAHDFGNGARAYGVQLVPGVEITTWEPEFGHFNLFPTNHAPAYKRSSPERLLAALPPPQARFIQVNHPRLLRHIGYFELAHERDLNVAAAMRQGFDGIEVWNGYDLHRPEQRDRVIADWLSLVAAGRKLVATGGSDSHDLVHTIVGYPRTYVELPASVDLAQPLAAALRAGRAFVSNGPVLELEVEGHAPGESVSVARNKRHVHVSVRVDAPAWMDLQSVELWLDGKRVRRLPVAPWTSPAKRPEQSRAQLRLDLPISAGRAHSVLAMVRGERAMHELFGRREVTPFAFTNPVWLTRTVK
jgi:hypothetical protein